MRSLFVNNKLTFLFVIFILAPCFLQEVVAQSTVNNFRLYTVKDGLASNYVKNLLIDSKGYLWVGTLEGINRFDGESFTNLITDAKDFTSRSVEWINQVNDSIILIGTSSGLVVFNLNNNQFQNSQIKDTLLKAGSTTFVRSIVRLPNDKCLIAGGNYVFLLDRHLNVIRSCAKQRKVYFRRRYNF